MEINLKKLLILDSNSIINRAFYGIRHLSAKDGTPTNAIYGFMNIMLKLTDEFKPDYICAAFDLKAPTFRHKMYADYKAQRKPMPDDLRVQMPIAKDILRAMNIKILEIEGYEADDIIGTVSRRCEADGIECLIATGDKDDLQLASDKTKVVLTVTRSGINETVVYDDNAVKEKYGVTPSEFIDVKALMGDPSDNIPGVKGIGEKTALSLISKFSSIEYIYDNIDNIGLKGAALQKMIDGKDMAFMSKKLATIDTSVPIEIDFEECVSDKEYGSGLYELLEKLALNSLIKRLDVKKSPSEKNELVDIFKDMKTEIIKDASSLLGKEPAVLPVFFDDSINSVYIACGDTVYYNTDNAEEITKAILSDKNTSKIMFDSKDIIVRLSGKCDVVSIADDVIIGGYLLDPAQSEYTIDKMAMTYLSAEIEKNENRQLSLFDDEINDDEYYIKCAYALPKIRDVINADLENQGQTALYRDIELPLVRVLADMQIYGFKVDKSSLDEFGKMLSTRIDGLISKIYALAGEEFNINSPKQLGVILFEKLSLPVIKKTKSGYSTGVEVLEKLSDKHEIIPCIMEYRQLAKLKSTYCDSLSQVINPETGKIHSVFNQTVTVTGRISSTEPNMQNIPTRTALGREMRKMFTASENGRVLVDADYSQIELRVLAHIANDETMINAFLNNEDIHAVTASQVLGIPLEEVTSEQRSSAKAINFGIVYGIGEYSLSQDLHISVAEAKAYMNSYLDKYHGVREYMQKIKDEAKQSGLVKTMMNRVRYIPEIKSGNFNIRKFGERVALNTPIQGTAADIIKLAMVRVHKRLGEELPDAKLILQVHDELIVDCLEKDASTVHTILKEEMENAVSLAVPLTVDISQGWSWYDAK